MIVKMNSATFTGINGTIVSVEIDISSGLPAFNIVGLGDMSVRESKERVRSAIINSGFDFPAKRITVNLAPADLKKEGSLFDLPIALGILIATGQIIGDTIEKFIFMGELSLSGELKRIKGALPIVIEGINKDIDNFIVPMENAEECAVIKKAKIYSFDNIKQVINFIKYRDMLPYELSEKNFTKKYNIDFQDVIGQESAKRAIEIAASGGHNILLYGSPGCGKSMLAKRIPTILPKLNYSEALEVTKIYSISGNLAAEGLIEERPFRSPHHTSSKISLVGGGSNLMPGEISLAHNGVLFLDEILEYNKSVLEVLRQPLEDRVIKISRSTGSVNYPANFMLVAAMNPCPCGYNGSVERECTCSEYQKKRYINKLSGPLLDRIDIFIPVNSLSYKELTKKNSDIESSLAIRNRVEKARDMQKKRFEEEGIYCNAEMNEKLIKKHCELNFKGKAMIKKIFEKYNISTRSYSRILKVSRSIADLDGRERISEIDVFEAIQYRKYLDKKII